MAKKQTDLLRDPVTMASARYKEQIDSFKAQFIPRQRNPIREMLKQTGIDMKEWRETFNDTA